jgi:hypothetical protein
MSCKSKKLPKLIGVKRKLNQKKIPMTEYFRQIDKELQKMIISTKRIDQIAD